MKGAAIKRKKLGNDVNCPEEHDLKRFRVDKEGFKCDICEHLIDERQFIYSCDACRYDVCHTCMKKDTKSKNSNEICVNFRLRSKNLNNKIKTLDEEISMLEKQITLKNDGLIVIPKKFMWA